jgi:RimJ/RimL family protein N-acetyltransferase
LGKVQTTHFFKKTGQAFTIRSARPEDAEKVLAFNRSVFTEASYLLTTSSEFKMTVEKEEKFLKQSFDNEGWLAIVAEYNGEIIGFLNFQNRHKYRIKHQGSLGMSVAKEYRNQGIGRALLKTLLNWAKENPIIEKVCLEVFDANTNAISLYKKLGFVEEGRKIKGIKIDDETYHDIILMAIFTK